MQSLIEQGTPAPPKEFMEVKPHFTWNEFHLPYNQFAQMQPVITTIVGDYTRWYNEQMRQQQATSLPPSTIA